MILDGQEISYNPYTKQVHTTIIEPFKTANKMLGWPNPHGAGLGFNQSVIDFVIQHKCFFVVKVMKNPDGSFNGHRYWVNYDRLEQFLKNNYCKYEISGKTLKVVSWKIFVKVDEHG